VSLAASPLDGNALDVPACEDGGLIKRRSFHLYVVV
jgi:hypothetical protein